jgi:hypothetical protein
MPTKKRRRRKKKHYKTGTHKSPKCKTPIEYRSGWELEVAKYLDLDPQVQEYGYECLAIEYVSNTRTQKVRSYYPDFLITYKDGSRKLAEVKRKDKLNDPLVIKKAKAAEEWCAKQNPKIVYEFWTNTMIEAFRKINEAAEMTQKPVISETLKQKVKAQVRKRRKPKKSSK